MANYFDLDDNWNLKYNYSLVKAHYLLLTAPLKTRITVAFKAAYNIIRGQVSE